MDKTVKFRNKLLPPNQLKLSTNLQWHTSGKGNKYMSGGGMMVSYKASFYGALYAVHVATWACPCPRVASLGWKTSGDLEGGS